MAVCWQCQTLIFITIQKKTKKNQSENLSEKIRQVSPILPSISHSLSHNLLISHTSWVTHWLSGVARYHCQRSGNARHYTFTHPTYFSKFLSISNFFYSFIQPISLSNPFLSTFPQPPLISTSIHTYTSKHQNKPAKASWRHHHTELLLRFPRIKIAGHFFIFPHFLFFKHFFFREKDFRK